MTANYKTRIADNTERDICYVGRKRAEKNILMAKQNGGSEVYVGLKLTGFGVHLIRRELERRNTEEYKSYK
jgi:hypothetical protein